MQTSCEVALSFVCTGEGTCNSLENAMVKISFWLENHAYILVHAIELTASYLSRIIGDYQIIILLLKKSGHPVVFHLLDLYE